MKRTAALCLATGAAMFAAVGVASADPSSPPNCYGQEISNGASSNPGALGPYVSGWAHFFNSVGTSLGETGVPGAKQICPTSPGPPPAS